MRLAIRSALYAVRKDSFGCSCTNETCPKHLRLDVPDPDPAATEWIRHLWRLEELKHVGCVWGVNDLSWAQWQGLIWMAHEREWVNTRVDALRTKLSKMEGGKPFDNSAEAFFAEGRKAIPPPKKTR
jgi:hypothetical protein